MPFVSAPFPKRAICWALRSLEKENRRSSY